MMMKISTTILFTLLILLIAGMLCSNIVIKKEYDKIDKSDLYWTYKKVLQAPFKYLKITGGNNTHIAFEQSATSSVRIFEDWSRYHKGDIDAFVKNDTLFVNFSFVPQNENERIWLRNITPVRIFAPQLLYVDGFNTNLEMFKMKQKQYTVRMTGKSSFEVESMTPNLDSLNITQQDSSQVVFEMSPEFNVNRTDEKKEKIITVNTETQEIITSATNGSIRSKEAMSLRSLTASVAGVSLLDVGHAQIGTLRLNVADSSGILLSGGGLKKAQK
jgi:hypothetical protein